MSLYELFVANLIFLKCQKRQHTYSDISEYTEQMAEHPPQPGHNLGAQRVEAHMGAVHRILYSFWRCKHFSRFNNQFQVSLPEIIAHTTPREPKNKKRNNCHTIAYSKFFAQKPEDQSPPFDARLETNKQASARSDSRSFHVLNLGGRGQAFHLASEAGGENKTRSVPRGADTHGSFDVFFSPPPPPLYRIAKVTL